MMSEKCKNSLLMVSVLNPKPEINIKTCDQISADGTIDRFTCFRRRSNNSVTTKSRLVWTFIVLFFMIFFESWSCFKASDQVFSLMSQHALSAFYTDVDPLLLPPSLLNNIYSFEFFKKPLNAQEAKFPAASLWSGGWGEALGGRISLSFVHSSAQCYFYSLNTISVNTLLQL